MKNLKNLSFVIAAILALYFLVTAGYQYVTSGGNAEKTKKAGQTILYASIGLILVILSYTLITWVFKIGTTAVNPIDDFCTEVNTSSRYDGEDNTVCDSNVTDKFNDAAGVGFLDKNGFVSRIIKFISFLTGFLAVIFIVVGGLQFTFSGGDAEKTKKAKKMILFARIGVGVTVASNVILRFAISIANG